MARMHSSATVTIHGAFADADDELVPVAPRARDGFFPRKLLILLGLLILASGLVRYSSIFGDLIRSF
jgi:hypothetical protein